MFLFLILGMPLVHYSQTGCETASDLVTKALVEFYDNKNDMEAIKLLTKAIDMCPSNAFAYYNRGNIKLKMEDYRGAGYDFKEAIDLGLKNDDTKASCYYGLGICLYSLGDKLNGCKAFTMAGELGLEKVYEAIRKYCN